MKEIHLYVARYVVNVEGDRNVIGDLYLDKNDSDPFCYTLEDEIRAKGVKVKGKTAIQAGTYDMIRRYSPRFKRNVYMLYNDTDDKGIKYVNGDGDKDFYYVLIHGGNDSTNTEGCILVAYNSDGSRISGTAEKALTAKLDEYDSHKITIENKFLTHRGRLNNE